MPTKIKYVCMNHQHTEEIISFIRYTVLSEIHYTQKRSNHDQKVLPALLCFQDLALSGGKPR